MTSFSQDSQSAAEIHDVLDRALSQLKSLRESRTEPLAIIGMACRFPGASTPEAFWELLSEGRCEIRETPADRWTGAEYLATAPGQKGRITSNQGSYLENVDQFDAAFFHMSGREANLLDPQQRLLLEVAWETLENAGINPQSTKGTATGVYVGICSSDYLHLITRHNPLDLDAWVSTGNAHGSAAGRLSYVFDWRGPSVAIDTACSSSLVALHFAVQALRNDECRMAFACGVNLMLAPDLSISLSQAGMLSPDGRCKTFSEAANGFVRGEGCGGVLLKRISHAIADGDNIVCVIRGSATNQDGRSIGLTAPNGLAQQAVIRAALQNARLSAKHISYIEAHGTGTALGDPIEMSALQEVFAPTRSVNDPLRIGSVKTNLGHLEGAAGIAGVIKTALALSKKTLPPHLHCGTASTRIDWDWPVTIPKTLNDWTVSNGHRRAAGVSSFGFGGSNAHVILEEYASQPREPIVAKSYGSILKISAKSHSALRELAKDYLERLDDVEFESLCYTSCVGRADFSRRIAMPATTADRMRQLLQAWLDGESSIAGVCSGDTEDDLRCEWLFPAQLDFDALGLRTLYERNALFQKEWDKVESTCETLGLNRLSDILWNRNRQTDAEGAIATVAVQWIYGQLMLHWGLVPSRIVGQGLGEISGGALAGLLSLADALRLASDPNYADRMVISDGLYPYESMRRDSHFRANVLTRGYWRHVAAVPIKEPLSSEKLRNSRGLVPVVFGSKMLLCDGHCASEPLLVMAAMGAESHPLLHLACQAYAFGAALNWSAVFPAPVKKTSLPTYPFQRKSHWFTARPLSEFAKRRSHPLLTSFTRQEGSSTSIEIDLSRIGYLRNHRIRNVPLCPLTFLLEVALAGVSSQTQFAQTPLKVTDLIIQRPVLWPSNTSCPLRATFRPSGQGMECRFQVLGNMVWVESAHCQVVPMPASSEPMPVLPDHAIAQSIPEHYERFESSGLTYEGEFVCVRSLHNSRQKDAPPMAWGRVCLPDSVNTNGYSLHPALLDGCLQVAMTILKEDAGTGWMPIGVKEYEFYRVPESRDLISIVNHVQKNSNSTVHVDLLIFDSTETVVAKILGLTLKEVSYRADALLGVGLAPSSAAIEEAEDRSLLDPTDRVPIFVRSRVASILDLSSDNLELTQPLLELGMDSIMAIELRNEILTEFQIELSMEELLEILTPQDLIARLVERLEEQAKPEGFSRQSDWVEGAI